ARAGSYTADDIFSVQSPGAVRELREISRERIRERVLPVSCERLRCFRSEQPRGIRAALLSLPSTDERHKLRREQPVPRRVCRRLKPSVRGGGEALVCVYAGASTGVIG
ncbi:unnamed protein product, partial [Ectocarpus sp. 12 AP-2014]